MGPSSLPDGFIQLPAANDIRTSELHARPPSHFNSVTLPPADVIAKCCCKWMTPPSLSLAGISLHEGTAERISFFEAAMIPDDVMSIKVFVDGTGGKNCDADRPGVPAWAMCIFFARPSTGIWKFGGYYTRPVARNGKADYIWAIPFTSNTAELSAMVWATLFCMQYPGASVEIGYDSQYAAHTTLSLWKVAMSPLAYFAQSLIACLKTVSVVLFTHIPSHEGHPWNELSDTLCDLPSKGIWESPLDVPPCNIWHKVVRPFASSGSTRSISRDS